MILYSKFKVKYTELYCTYVLQQFALEVSFSFSVSHVVLYFTYVLQ